MKKRFVFVEVTACMLLVVLAIACLVHRQLEEQVKLFAALPPQMVQAAMAAREQADAYARGLAALEAAGYGSAYSRLLLAPFSGLLALLGAGLLALVAAVAFWRRHARQKAQGKLEAYCRWLRSEGGEAPPAPLPQLVREACEGLRRDKLDAAQAQQAAMEALRRYHADVLHQINTPLAVLRLSLERQGLEADVAQVEKAALLVKDALELDRIGSGAVKLHFQRVSLSELLEVVTNDLEPLAEARGVTVEAEADGDIVWCCDPFWMQEALENLLKNALEYSPSGSAVTLRCTQTPQENCLQMEDSGPGFSQEMASRLFTRYAFVRRKEGESHGLGLSIARELTRLHFGSLSLQNRPSGGAAFLLRFPRLEPEQVYGEKSR